MSPDIDNSQLANFFFLSTDLLCIATPEGHFTKVNPAFCRALGYSEVELTQIPFLELVHPDDRAATLDEMQLQLKFGCASHFENRYITRDGNILWLSWNSTRLVDGHLYAAARDITPLKAAARELETSERKFRTLVQNGNEIISIIDSSGRYAYHSDSILRILGYAPGQLIGCAPRDIIHPDDLEKLSGAFSQLSHQQYVSNLIPYRVRTADGSYRWLESSASNMTSDPAIHGIVVNSRDVTEKVLLQQALTLQASQREKEMAVSMFRGEEQERQRLAYELHDNINQLLTSAKLYIEFIQTQGENHQLQEKCRLIVVEVMSEIRKLTHQLSLPVQESFDLAHHIRELSHNMLWVAGIPFQLGLDCLEQLRLNEEFKIVLYRIFQEQMTNIVKHAEATLVTLTMKLTAGRLHVTIHDNGKGFDPSTQSKGIGLLNIESRAAIFGGRATIGGSPGAGFRLELNFPLAEITV